MATFYDSFTDSDGVALATHDANWTATNIVIQSNQAAWTGTAGHARVTGVSIGDDQYAQATIGTPYAAYTGISVRVRFNGTDYFAATVRSNQLTVYRTATILNTDTGISWAAGNVVRLEVEGSQLRVYKNGTLVKTLTDATTWGGTKRPGIGVASAGVSWADFEGGDLVSSLTLPDEPTGVSVSSVTRTGATLSWTDASSDEDGFDVEVAPTPFSSWTTVAATAANATSQAITGLAEGTVHKARVRAFNDADSDWVESATFTTLTRKLKAVIQGDAVGDTGIAGAVFAAPTGGDITGAKLGEFTGASAVVDGSNAAVKIAIASIAGAESLAPGDSPRVYLQSATKNSPMVTATVVDEA